MGAVTDRFAEPILHVDMDAFFVEVERLRRPELRGRPVLVGGLGPRAVVAAASYEARAFGVGSAMPMTEARRRCPPAVLVAPDHRQYGAASREVFEVLASFTPLVERLSVDEAFLDVGGLRLHFDGPAEIGEAIRLRLRRQVGLPASVGGAVNKFIAKLASEEAKPDGVLIVEAGTEESFLSPLSVRRLWGVGEATFAGLETLGVHTVGELAATPETTLRSRLGASLGRHLSALAAGRDERVVEPGGEAKSISVEQTYSEDLHDDTAIEDAVFKHCDSLATRLASAGLVGRTISLKIRFGDFTTITRSRTVDAGVGFTSNLWAVASELLHSLDRAGRGVRLLGVGASELVLASAPRQLAIGDGGTSAAAEAAEGVRRRFGNGSVIPARLAPDPQRSRRDSG